MNYLTLPNDFNGVSVRAVIEISRGSQVRCEVQNFDPSLVEPPKRALYLLMKFVEEQKQPRALVLLVVSLKLLIELGVWVSYPLTYMEYLLYP